MPPRRSAGASPPAPSFREWQQRSRDPGGLDDEERRLVKEIEGLEAQQRADVAAAARDAARLEAHEAQRAEERRRAEQLSSAAADAVPARCTAQDRYLLRPLPSPIPEVPEDSPAESSAGSPESTSTMRSFGRCVVCQTRTAGIALDPCGHIALCTAGCAAKVNWVANKRFEISKLKFEFPTARTYEIIGLFLFCIEVKLSK